MTEREKLVEEMVIAATGEYPSRWISSISMSAALTIAEAAIRADEREACARATENVLAGYGGFVNGEAIAAAIRAREEGA